MSEDLENLGIKNFEFTEFKSWWGRSYAFHCNELSETDYILSIKGEVIKKGNIKKGETKKVNCKCKKRPKEQGGRPYNEKGGRLRTCKWVYKKSPWTKTPSGYQNWFDIILLGPRKRSAYVIISKINNFFESDYGARNSYKSLLGPLHDKNSIWQKLITHFGVKMSHRLSFFSQK